MGLPRRSLGDGEQVVLDVHPHWRRLTVPTLLVPVVVGLASYLVFLLPAGRERSTVRWAVVGAAVVLLLRFSLWPWLRWQATHYVVTDRRVVVRTGVLGRSGRDIPLARVNDVSFRRSLLERLMRSGTLTIESGGEQGRLVLHDVPSVELVQRQLYRMLDAQLRRLGGVTGSPVTPSTDDWFWSQQ